MAKKKNEKPVEAEEVVTAEEPVAVSVAEAKLPQPELEEPAQAEQPRRSAHERQLEEEAYQAERMRRQEAAITVGKYINAKKRNNVLGGVVAGTEIYNGHPFWAIYEGPVTVLIPFHEALPEQPADIAGKVERQRQMLAKSIGASVAFSVEDLIENGDTYLAVGSRIKGNRRVSSRYFGKDAVKPVKVGDIVQAEFLAVGPHAAWVTVYGVDVRMSAAQVSHRYMRHLNDYYKAGDKIDVRVQKIEYADDKVELVVSALPCEIEAAKANLNRIRKGNRYNATIASHRIITLRNRETGEREKVYSASMWLEGVDLPAYANTPAKSSGIAHSGDQVTVEVDGVTKGGYVRVKIVAFLPN